MGFSLGEILLLVLVGIIVVGPKRLPGMMRTAGQWVARLRRMSSDLRSQSGIDDLLRQEGLEQHIHELRSLSRMNVMDSLMAPAVAPRTPRSPAVTGGGSLDTPPSKFDRPKIRPFAYRPDQPLREREYPLIGCDAYGAVADDAVIYDPGPARDVAKEAAGEPVVPAAIPADAAPAVATEAEAGT